MKISNAILKYVIMLEMLQSSQPSTLSKVLCIFLTLKFAAIQFGWRTFLQLISEHQSPKKKFLIKAAIFSEQHRLYWNESNFLSAKKFFRTPSCLEQLLFSKNYFLVTNTFSDQLLLEDKYFFSTSAVSKEELFWSKYFLRTQTSFSTVTFFEKLVLRNQLHRIYTWKDFPLTMMHSFKYTTSWSAFEIP